MREIGVMRKPSKLTIETLCCPTLEDLPLPPDGKSGWPWTEESAKVPDKMPDGRLWPKISIVTPSYNQGQFIEEAIRSILLQGYPDLEYIIIDGGSTDRTVEIIKKYEPWLAYWESKPDKGQSHAINKGLEKSTGKLFNWHNSDDILMPDSLTTIAKAGYIHGKRIFINNVGNLWGCNKDGYNNTISFSPELAASVSALKTGCQPACLMGRDLVIQAGRVDENLHYIMDIDLLLRIALVKPPIHIDSPFVYVRAHPDTKSLQWNSQRARERIYVAEKIFSREGLPSPIVKLRKQTLATAHRFAWRCYGEAKMYRLALRHLLLDILYSPWRAWGKRLTNYKLLRFGSPTLSFISQTTSG
jgi:glycosyltransferase involved in cell wall biosynthesis